VWRAVAVVTVLLSWPLEFAFSGVGDPTAAIDRYVEPYAASNNFSGVVLIARHGKAVYEQAYGFEDQGTEQRNTPQTRFHLASMSMQFTAAAVMRLVELGKLKLDQVVSMLVPGLPNGDKITIRELLEQTSGLPDVNALPNYSDILNRHQTAGSLVSYIKDKSPRFEPGSASQGEEHSAFNVLALIVEKVTKQSFAAAVKRLVFVPAKMQHSGIDEDGPLANAATGYSPVGVRDLEKAPQIHWSAKTGNASAYATARDLLDWRNAFFGVALLSGRSRQLMLDYSHSRVGYGWFKGASSRLAVPVFHMNGRAPGFASFIMEVPSEELTVIILSNTYVSAVSDMGFDLTALMLGKPYTSAFLNAVPTTSADVSGIANRYRFGADFFQANATLQLEVHDLDASLHWPSGETTFLIPVSKDHFVDRSYWEPVSIQRSADLQVESVMYDRFVGRRVAAGGSDLH
jgi:CubicO group peptidase (beta-lactamase class C family)